MQHKIRNLLSISVCGKLKEKSNYIGLLILIQASAFGVEASISGKMKSYSSDRFISRSANSVTTKIEGLYELKSTGSLDDSSDTKLKNKPKWVDMMYDSNVNYFQAKKEFQEFWKDRGEPEEKDEHEKKEKRSLAKRIMKSDKAIEEENTELLLPYKRFRKWLVDMEPYVQPDGSILSIEEQKQIWENSRK